MAQKINVEQKLAENWARPRTGPHTVYSTQGKTMKCMADSKKNKHRDLGSKRVIHEFESPGKVLEIGF